MEDDSTTPERSGMFSSFASPGYPSLWWAGLFSFLSVQMQFLLRGLLAWDLTGRESALGGVSLAFGLTMLIATPLGGVASDRLSKRLILVASQGVIMAIAVSMGTAVLTGVVQYWMLLVAGAAQGLAFGFFGPARVAISSELVGRDHIGNAITLSLLSMSGTRVFAPAMAGFLAGLVFIGIGGAYLISAAASTVSFFFLLRLPGSPPAEAEGEAAATTRGWVNPFSEVLDGIRYVWARPVIRRLTLASFGVIMFGFNYIAFLPALVKGEYGLGDTWVGIISSASAIGAVAVSFPLAARADSQLAGPAMKVAGFAFGAGVVALATVGSFWPAFAIIVVIGAATTVFQSLSNTIALGLSDAAHQGRVQSLLMLSFAGFGIAALPLGALAEVIGLRPAIAVMGGVTIASMVIYEAAEHGLFGSGRATPTSLEADEHLVGRAAA
ncbi:MAG: MFS transporter [Actinomycetota bacterium]